MATNYSFHLYFGILLIILSLFQFINGLKLRSKKKIIISILLFSIAIVLFYDMFSYPIKTYFGIN
jgi:uncharacterized membrane protein